MVSKNAQKGDIVTTVKKRTITFMNNKINNNAKCVQYLTQSVYLRMHISLLNCVDYICVRTDENKTYILQNEPATEISNWLELATPTDLVQSVNGKTGAVTVNYEDVGAVQANTEITGGSKCKITYDSKGLVTAGEDLTSADIPDISATYETKSNKSDSFTESSSTTYASTKALVDGLGTKAEVKKYNVTLSSDWSTDSDGKYYKQVDVEGILGSDTPIIDLILSDNADTAAAQIEAWSCVSKITTDNGSVKAYCYETKPAADIQLQMLCIR